MDKKILTIICAAVVVVVVALIIIGMAAPAQNSDPKVTYDANGGAVEGHGTTYTCNETSFVELKAIKSGYAFEGWYKDKDVWSQKMNNGDAITSDITVYAKWTPAFSLRTTEFGISDDSNVFDIITKTGQQKMAKGTVDLPDSGKSKLIATSGSEFTTVVGDELVQGLRYKVDDNYYYTYIVFDGAKSVKVGIDADTHMGYIEFTYSSNITVAYNCKIFVVEYKANGGHFGADESVVKKGITTSTTVLNYNDTLLDLKAPAGQVFDYWSSDADGTMSYSVGSEVDIATGKMPFLTLYAQYKTP